MRLDIPARPAGEETLANYNLQDYDARLLNLLREGVMAQKTVRFNQSGINKLPNDKPVVYRIQTDGSKTNYVGVAQRGRVQARLQEHLAGAKDAVPGSKVQIQQTSSIDTAKKTEALAIARTQPKYNKQGK